MVIWFSARMETKFSAKWKYFGQNHVIVKQKLTRIAKIMADQWRLTTPDLLSQVKQNSFIILFFCVSRQRLYILLSFLPI